jgi:hypothetical protein
MEKKLAELQNSGPTYSLMPYQYTTKQKIFILSANLTVFAVVVGGLRLAPYAVFTIKETAIEVGYWFGRLFGRA